MDDDVELRILRERVYGTEGDRATPAMIARLVELEDRVRRSADGANVPASEAGAHPEHGRAAQPGRTTAAHARTSRPAPAPGRLALPDSSDSAVSGPSVQSAPGPTASPEPTMDPTDATASAPRPVLRAVLIAVGALALLGLGAAIGSTANATVPAATADSAGAATADPAAAISPELTFPQTIEDAISADVLRDSALDSGSTRYIATVNGFDIYLAQPADGVGRCIVTFTATDDQPWSAGCAMGAQEGSAVFGIDDRLSVAIGDPADSEVDGIPIRLSESVTAYVAR